MVTVAYVDSDGIERSHTVGPEPVLIGRAPECGIRSNDPLVSRNHARMYVDATGALIIEALGSANGVFVGPNRVTTSPIPVGAVVVVGSMRFRVLAGAAAALSPTAAIQAQEAAAKPTRAVMLPSALPQPPLAPSGPPGGGLELVAHLLEVERRARIAIEDERDAYGARLAEIHRELASARASLEAAEARIAELSRTVSDLAERLARGSQADIVADVRAADTTPGK